MVFCVSVGCFVLFSFISFSTLKGMCIILTLIAGKFRKHMSGYSFVCQGSWHFQWCHTLSDGAKIFHFHLNSTSKHLDLPEQQIKKKKVPIWDKCINVLGGYVEKCWYFFEIIHPHLMLFNFITVKCRTSMNILNNLYIIIYAVLCTYTVLLELVFGIALYIFIVLCVDCWVTLCSVGTVVY